MSRPLLKLGGGSAAWKWAVHQVRACINGGNGESKLLLSVYRTLGEDLLAL
jgi:hypothetical protein